VPGVIHAHARARWTGRTLRVEIEGWVDPELPAKNADAIGRLVAELGEKSEDVIDWRLVHQTGSYSADATRIIGRRSSGRGGDGCFAVLGPQGAGQPFEVRHGHGERRVATSAKR
jgi:hypothetical protein